MHTALLSYAEVTTDNLHSLRAAAQRLGIELVEVEPHRLSCWVDGAHRQVLLDGVPFTPQVVIHRTVARIYPVVGPALQVLAEAGVPVLNDPDASWVSRDKLLTALALSRAGIAFVATLGIDSGPDTTLPPGAGLRVSKPALGLRGEGVKLHPDAAATQAHLRALPWEGPGRHQVVQPLAGPGGTDLRAYVVDGRCIGLMRRTAPAGEFRTNLALGASGVPEHHPEAEALAVAAVSALGLDHAGVDIIDGTEGLRVLEVDAWAGFAGIERVCGVDVAGAILTLAAERIR